MVSYLEAIKKGNTVKQKRCYMCEEDGKCDKEYDIHEIDVVNTSKDEWLKSSKIISKKSTLPICNKCIKTVIECTFCNKKLFENSLKFATDWRTNEPFDVCKRCFSEKVCQTCLYVIDPGRKECSYCY